MAFKNENPTALGGVDEDTKVDPEEMAAAARC